jgi:hypothetical protein
VDAGSQALVVALIAALLTGTPALVWAIIRSKRVGPAEEQELVSRAANQAVAAMEGALKAAVEERKALVNKVTVLESEVGRLREANGRCNTRIARLEAAMQTAGIPVPD